MELSFNTYILTVKFSLMKPMGSKLTDLADLAPSGDYALNAFLLELNDDLTDEDLGRLKFLCSGKYGIGKSALEKVEKPIDLFNILREKEKLNEMNIITLQAMLWSLPRRDLQKKYVEFAKSLGSSIHFVLPRDTPENGYKYLKFHIMGADLETYQRPELEKLRSMIAELLRVPPEFVIVSGIEPSNSLLITIMVLEDDAQRMSTLPSESLTIFTEMFVNCILVDKEKIQISGEAKRSLDHNAANSRIEEEARKALYRQSQAERELEKAHDKISKLQSDLSSAKFAMFRSFQLVSYIMVVLLKECHDVCNKLITWKRVLEAIAFESVDKLQKMCVLRIFRHRLQKVRELGYNEEIICDLLDAQAMVFQWHKHERKDIEIANLRNQLAYTAWERDKLAFYHGIGEQDKIMSQREEFFLAAMASNIPVNIQQNILVRQELSKECVDNVFRRLSKDVSDSELMTLNKLNRHHGKHSLKKANSTYEYLLNIWNDQKQAVDLRSFVNEFLATPLNKQSLLTKMEIYVSEFYADSGKPQSSGQSTKKSSRRKNRHTVLANRLKQNYVNKTETGASAAMGLHDQVQEILKRLDKIEKNTERREMTPYDKLMKGSPLENISQYCPPSFLNGKINAFNLEERKVY